MTNFGAFFEFSIFDLMDDGAVFTFFVPGDLKVEVDRALLY